YKKETNTSEDQWTDLIATTQAVSKGHSASVNSITWEPDYVPSIEATIDVEQFMRWFSVQTLIVNVESNIWSSVGDDYFIYFGEHDPRARLVPHDLDTILGDGDVWGWPTYYQDSQSLDIFSMTTHAYNPTQ